MRQHTGDTQPMSIERLRQWNSAFAVAALGCLAATAFNGWWLLGTVAALAAAWAKNRANYPKRVASRPLAPERAGVAPDVVWQTITTLGLGRLLTRSADTVDQLANEQGRFLGAPDVLLVPEDPDNEFTSPSALFPADAALSDDDTGLFVYRDRTGELHLIETERYRRIPRQLPRNTAGAVRGAEFHALKQ